MAPVTFFYVEVPLTKPFPSGFHRGHSKDRQSDQVAVRADQHEQLIRLAALVAVGETTLPTDLEHGELLIVLAETARIRRRKLIRFIARAIAQDIHRGSHGT